MPKGKLLPGRHGPYFHKKQGYTYYVDVDSEGRRKTVYEHRLVVESELGRKLNSTEIVHHKNHKKVDNSKENLEILTNVAHATEHAKDIPTEMITLTCTFCGDVFERRAAKWRFRRNPETRLPFCSHRCSGKYYGFKK